MFTAGTWIHKEDFPEAVQTSLDEADLEEVLSAFPWTARQQGFIC
jgi:hypothetical protein